MLHSYSIPELKKSKGTFITTTSRIALLRVPSASDYAISKLAINRLIEFAIAGMCSLAPLSSVLLSGATENPEIRAFAVHPGVVATEMNKKSDIAIQADDSVQLPAALYLHLAAGKADYLSGR